MYKTIKPSSYFLLKFPSSCRFNNWRQEKKTSFLELNFFIFIGKVHNAAPPPKHGLPQADKITLKYA